MASDEQTRIRTELVEDIEFVKKFWSKTQGVRFVPYDLNVHEEHEKDMFEHINEVCPPLLKLLFDILGVQKEGKWVSTGPETSRSETKELLPYDDPLNDAQRFNEEYEIPCLFWYGIFGHGMGLVPPREIFPVYDFRENGTEYLVGAVTLFNALSENKAAELLDKQTVLGKRPIYASRHKAKKYSKQEVGQMLSTLYGDTDDDDDDQLQDRGENHNGDYDDNDHGLYEKTGRLCPTCGKHFWKLHECSSTKKLLHMQCYKKCLEIFPEELAGIKIVSVAVFGDTIQWEFLGSYDSPQMCLITYENPNVIQGDNSPRFLYDIGMLGWFGKIHIPCMKMFGTPSENILLQEFKSKPECHSEVPDGFGEAHLEILCGLFLSRPESNKFERWFHTYKLKLEECETIANFENLYPQLGDYHEGATHFNQLEKWGRTKTARTCH